MPVKRKILIISPSRIIARGLAGILEEHGAFAVETVLSDLSRENEATVRDSMADTVIVDPAIFGFSFRANGRNRISELTDASVVAISTVLADDESAKNYDETISIYDTPSTVISKLRSTAPHTDKKAENSPAREELSSREKEILVCVAKGMLNKEIADRYHISIYTVITHRKNITRKTGIKTVAGLTVYALLNNMIGPESME